MAALIAMPAVAFVLLMTMIYEDRLLPRPDPMAAPADEAAEPVKEAAPASPSYAAEPREEPAAVTRTAADDARRCKARQDTAPRRPRTHRPTVGAVPERHATPPRPPDRSPKLRLEGLTPTRSH